MTVSEFETTNGHEFTRIGILKARMALRVFIDRVASALLPTIRSIGRSADVTFKFSWKAPHHWSLFARLWFHDPLSLPRIGYQKAQLNLRELRLNSTSN